MKLNLGQLQKINDTNNFIIEWCDYFSDFKDELIFSDDRVKEIVENEEEIECLEYRFPGLDEFFEFEISDLLTLTDEIKSIEIISNGYIKTRLRSYYIVTPLNTDEEQIIQEYYDLNLNWSNDIKLNFIQESFIVGLAATKLKEYDAEYWGTIFEYYAIEIVYDRTEDILTSEEEQQLIISYLFEVADSTGHALILSEIKNPINQYEILQDEAEENYNFALRPLEPYNEGMKLFISAVQINDLELKFLNFYKVLELFSPVALNIEANELMRKKLDAPKSMFEQGDYIKSIYELASSVTNRINDEDLIKASFNTCFDFIGLSDKLPESLIKRIKKQISAKELSYKLNSQEIATACNVAAKVIYKTRNKVVHAKSNFITTGYEIESEELTQLNKFMKEASSQAIRWYSRQPAHLKISILG